MLSSLPVPEFFSGLNLSVAQMIEIICKSRRKYFPHSAVVPGWDREAGHGNSGTARTGTRPSKRWMPSLFPVPCSRLIPTVVRIPRRRA
jgi:hypothetical protein